MSSLWWPGFLKTSGAALPRETELRVGHGWIGTGRGTLEDCHAAQGSGGFLAKEFGGKEEGVFEAGFVWVTRCTHPPCADAGLPRCSRASLILHTPKASSSHWCRSPPGWVRPALGCWWVQGGRKGGQSFNPSLKYYTRINSKWIMDLNANHNTI